MDFAARPSGLRVRPQEAQSPVGPVGSEGERQGGKPLVIPHRSETGREPAGEKGTITEPREFFRDGLNQIAQNTGLLLEGVFQLVKHLGGSLRLRTGADQVQKPLQEVETPGCPVPPGSWPGSASPARSAPRRSGPPWRPSLHRGRQHGSAEGRRRRRKGPEQRRGRELEGSLAPLRLNPLLAREPPGPPKSLPSPSNRHPPPLPPPTRSEGRGELPPGPPGRGGLGPRPGPGAAGAPPGPGVLRLGWFVYKMLIFVLPPV